MIHNLNTGPEDPEEEGEDEVEVAPDDLDNGEE